MYAQEASNSFDWVKSYLNYSFFLGFYNVALTNRQETEEILKIFAYIVVLISCIPILENLSNQIT